MADKTSILKGKILRVSRIVIGIAVWAVTTWMLVSYGMTYPAMAIWIEKIQFLQAAMAFSISTVVVWLIVTLVFGRIYCSVACPLGVFQDICARLPRMGQYPSRRYYHYSLPLTRWRNISLACVMVSIFLGITVASTFLDPWSIYSRACDNIFKPSWGYILNLFSNPAVKIASASVIGISVSVISMILIGWVATKNGRTFCNSLCPVGTTLGYVSRYAIYHIDINTDKCTQCRKCEHVCKASCIDLISHVVDSSRCVDCFDCLTVCQDDAIHYTWSRHSLSTPLMMKVDNPFKPNTRRYKLGGYTGCNQCSDSQARTSSGNRKPK